MRIEGSLAKWNDDRGFGFITPAQGGPEVFVHISAFPKDGKRPTVGEQLSFEIEIDQNGKKRATRLLCPNRRPTKLEQQKTYRQTRRENGMMPRIIVILMVLALALYGYKKFTRIVSAPPMQLEQSQESAATALEQSQESAATPTLFSCDGRTQCSQMTSCAEASFFLQHCPNVQMDGDHDGVPCEQQWCS